MGWRIRKHYYTVKNRQNPKQELLLAWVEFGPDKHLQDKDIQGVFKTLGTLRHTYIEPIVHQHVTDNGALIIRNFHPAGTLHDILCVTKPKQPFIKKYGNPKQIKSLVTSEVATYGYQVNNCYKENHSKARVSNILCNDDNISFVDTGGSRVPSREGITLWTFTHRQCNLNSEVR